MKKIKILSLCLITVLLLTACGSKKPAETTIPEETIVAEETSVPETTETATETMTLPRAAEDHIIETPYGDLRFPGDWVPFLKTETTEDPYTVTFFAALDTREEPQKLFALSFGGDAEKAVAAVKTVDGYAAVSVDYETFNLDETWSARDINIIYTMQDTLNHIMENLPLEDADVLLPPQTAPGSPVGNGNQESQPKPQEAAPGSAELPESMKEDLAMDTPYMELHYPAKWADSLSIHVDEENGFAVGYYCSMEGHEELLLFTVSFGGQNGIPLKTIKTAEGEMVEIRIDVPELSMSSDWLQEEQDTARAMQEDLNYLLERLA